MFVISLMVAVGYAVGFRFEGGLLEALGAMGIALLFGYAFSWFFALVAMLVREPETAQVAGFVPLFPFVFASSVFVSPQSMPSWLRTFAEHQPVTKVANAVRGLSLGTATTSDVVVTLLWIGGMLLVFAPLATWRYRKGWAAQRCCRSSNRISAAVGGLESSCGLVVGRSCLNPVGLPDNQTCGDPALAQEACLQVIALGERAKGLRGNASRLSKGFQTGS